jgi:hypothetical protein
MTVPLQPEFEVLGQPEISRAGVDEVLVQSAKEVWRDSKGQPGRGDEMFFNLRLIAETGRNGFLSNREHPSF